MVWRSKYGRSVAIRKQFALSALCVAASFIAGCSRHDTASQSSDSGGYHDHEKVLNLYNWADYIAPDTIPSFEKKTGIKVRVSYYDSNETLRTRMLAGNSGFDVTVPSATFFERETRSGAYLKLDKTKLPNLVNLDPAIMARVALNDPGNAYGVMYVWGTVGIGYNEKLVAQALPNVRLDSWRLIFDPEYAARLAKCGINVIDDPIGVLAVTLIYLGKNPNVPSPQDLVAAEQALARIRPYVRTVDTSSEIEAIANGDICISLGYNGDMVQARKRAQEANNGNKIGYVIPDEGSLLWFNLLAIPRDAPHAANAYLFINYILNPSVLDNITNAVGYANALRDPSPALDASIAADPVVYPTPEERKRLFVPTEDTPEQARVITRIWQKFKMGQ